MRAAPPEAGPPLGGRERLPPHKRARRVETWGRARLAVPARFPPRPGVVVLRAGPRAGLSNPSSIWPRRGDGARAVKRGPLMPGAGASALRRHHPKIYRGQGHTFSGGKASSPQTPLCTLPKKSESSAIPKTHRAKQHSPPPDSERPGGRAVAIARVTSRMENCERFPERSRANAQATAKCAHGERARYLATPEKIVAKNQNARRIARCTLTALECAPRLRSVFSAAAIRRRLSVLCAMERCAFSSNQRGHFHDYFRSNPELSTSPSRLSLSRSILGPEPTQRSRQRTPAGPAVTIAAGTGQTLTSVHR